MLVGTLKKLKVSTDESGLAHYKLSLSNQEIALNEVLGKKISLHFLQKIHCIHCGKETRKSFAQGFCYSCFRKIPEADLCLVRPETCHFHKGTCRDSEWGMKHCFVGHTVYLANSSGLKVGITRTYNELTRWLDQGASQALPILRVNKRLDAGIIESILKTHVSDKTNWRLLLKKDAEPIDLYAKRDELLTYIPEKLYFDCLHEEKANSFSYPILKYSLGLLD